MVSSFGAPLQEDHHPHSLSDGVIYEQLAVCRVVPETGPFQQLIRVMKRHDMINENINTNTIYWILRWRGRVDVDSKASWE